MPATKESPAKKLRVDVLPEVRATCTWLSAVREFANLRLHRAPLVLMVCISRKTLRQTGDISWSQLEQSGKVPSPRSGHTACAIERLCYVFGGCGCEADGDEAHVYNDLHVFDMAARTWDRVDCPPETGMRRPHAAVR
jgi:hypothetical protein